MRVLIVDDEPLARDRLRRMLSAIDNCTVVGDAGDGEQALAVAKEVVPDLVLMDVRMPGMDGLIAAQHLAKIEPPPAVIFCTAYDDYAVEAFSTQAIGYLLKPVKQTDLENVLSRTRRGIDLVAINDIRLFQADDKYVRAHHSQGESLLDETLKFLEDEYDGRFVRIHRNALVSIPHIEGIERNIDGQYFVRLQGLDFRPQVSRRHVAPLRKLLEQI